MFTGIVQSVGTIKERKEQEDGFTLLVETGLAPHTQLGGSVAVNGVCLTAEELSDNAIAFSIMGRTAARTNLAKLEEHSIVNLEPSLKVGDELGGHFVFGHVDGVGTITKKEERDDAVIFTITPEEPFPSEMLTENGSISIDGTSLTIASYEQGHFTVSIVPYTLKHTTFARLSVGDVVNLEIDMLARYAYKLKD